MCWRVRTSSQRVDVQMSDSDCAAFGVAQSNKCLCIVAVPLVHQATYLKYSGVPYIFCKSDSQSATERFNPCLFHFVPF